MMNKTHQGLKTGIIDAFPIIIGFVPIAMTFGVLAKNNDISMMNCFLFSAIVFAGASQFIAINILAAGAGAWEMVLTTLLVNFRHFLMSASLATKMTPEMKSWRPLIAFGVTDEVFSIMSFKKVDLTKEYILTLEYTAYIAWVGGTILGYLVGGVLPELLKVSMGIGLYAMFVAILVPEMKKSKKVVVLTLTSAWINTLLVKFLSMPQGWSIVLSIILTSCLGICRFKEEAKNE